MFLYLRPVCSVPCMKNLMLKVFIEILNSNLQLVLKSLFKAYHILVIKISVFGSYTVHVLKCYVSYCVKTRIHWGKRQSLVNHMFLLVLMLLALLNNQLYYIILSPTDFATFKSFLKSCCSCGFASEWL